MERRKIFSNNKGAPGPPQRPAPEVPTVAMAPLPQQSTTYGGTASGQATQLQAILDTITARDNHITYLYSLLRHDGHTNPSQPAAAADPHHQLSPEDVTDLRNLLRAREERVTELERASGAVREELDKARGANGELEEHVSRLEHEAGGRDAELARLAAALSALRAERDQDRQTAERRVREETDRLHAEHSGRLDEALRDNRRLRERLDRVQSSRTRKLDCIRCTQLRVPCSGDKPGCRECRGRAGGRPCMYDVCYRYGSRAGCNRSCNKIHDELGYRIKDGVLSGGIVETEAETDL